MKLKIKKYLDVFFIVLTCIFFVSSIFLNYEATTFFMLAIIFLLMIVISLSWRIHALIDRPDSDEKTRGSILFVCAIISTIAAVIQLLKWML